MKKLNQLLIVEAIEDGPSLLAQYEALLENISEQPPLVQTVTGIVRSSIRSAPLLVLLHCNLTRVSHLQNFVHLQSTLPYSTIIILTRQQDEELCLMALEAGAEDCTNVVALTAGYLRKAVLLSQRRARVESELSRSKEQLLACIQNTPNVAVQWYNSKGVVLFWNKASENIFGWAETEVLGKRIDQLFQSKQDAGFWQNKIKQMVLTHAPGQPEEWEFTHRNGRTGCCLTTVFPIPSFDKKPWFVCMDVDITEQKKTERKLQESEERYHALFSQASDAIFISERSGVFIDANEKALELCGYTRSALLQMKVADLYKQKDLEIQPLMWEALLRGDRTVAERNLVGANGQVIPIEVTAQLLTDGRIMAIARNISVRKQAEEALRASQQQLELIYNTATDVIFLLDVEDGETFRFQSANRAFFTTTGLAPEAVLGKRVTDVIPQPSLDLVLTQYRKAIQTKKPVSWEEESVYPAGIKTGVVNVAPFFDAEGNCTQLVGTVHDLTERKKAETQLIKSEEKYRSLIEQQADAITIFSRAGFILDVNSSATQLLQYSRQELQHLTLQDVLAPGETSHNPLDLDLLDKGSKTIKQRTMQRKDGSLVETEVHARRLDEGIYLASVRDLTERIEVQHQIQKEKQLSDSIINTLPGLFYLFNREGKYLRWNRQLETVGGYTAEEMLGISPLNFFDDADKVQVALAIEEVFRVGRNSIEANLVTKDGRRIPYFFNGVATQYAGMECLMGVGIDITEVRNLENELARQKITEQKKIMQAMISAAEKEKNKLGLELHDNVNQILSVVRMYLSLLESGHGGETVTLPQTMELLNSAMKEIRNLSHSLAVSYKFETGLTDALEELAGNIMRARDFSLSLNLPLQLDEVTAPQQKLAIYRIVQEQLNNIMKHAKATAVEVFIELPTEGLRLSITDNGKGFDSTIVQKGLGLNNIINRAEALNGNVVIQSAPGQGCSVTVWLPLSTME